MLKNKKYKAIIRYSKINGGKEFNLYSEDKDELVGVVSSMVFKSYGVFDPVLIKQGNESLGIIGSDGTYKDMKK